MACSERPSLSLSPPLTLPVSDIEDGKRLVSRPSAAVAATNNSTATLQSPLPATQAKVFTSNGLISRSASKDQVPQANGAQDATQQAASDPVSKQILKRSITQSVIPQYSMTATPDETSPRASEGLSSATLVSTSVDNVSLSRIDSAKLSSGQKDKKKGVSFFSRIIGTKKKDPSVDHADNTSEISESRPSPVDAEVFSHPIGFIPRFPAPPKYVKVRAQNTSGKDFDRVFLAQVLNDRQWKRKKLPDTPRSSLGSPVLSGPGSAPGNTNAIWAMEFSKDGRYLAAAGQDKIVRVWLVISNQDERQEYEAEEQQDGDDAVKLDAPVFQSKLVREYAAHESAVLDLSWSKNNFLLSSSMDKTVRLWHVSRKECLRTFNHPDFVTSIQFHPRDDRFFLAGSLDSKIRLWSIPEGEVSYSAQVANMVTAVAFTPDGRYSMAGTYDGQCLIYETDKMGLQGQIAVRSARGKNAKGSKITGIETMVLPRVDGNGETKLLITSNDSRVRMYNFNNRQLEVKFRGNENVCSQIHATFSDDGRYVICGSEDKRVYIWPTEVPSKDKEQEKRPVYVFESHSAIVTTAILAPVKAKQVLGQSGDPIYDIVSPPPVTLVDRTDSISSRPPTEGGRSASHAESDRNISLRESEKPRKKEETFPDGNIIVTADYAGTIRVFRQDCAFEKRQQLSWDTGSTFSKKILGRSGSVATRTSITSSHGRNSLSRSSLVMTRNPANERIKEWRNSIVANNTKSRDSLGSRNGSTRPRSRSPLKALNGVTGNAVGSPALSGQKSPSIISASIESSPQKVKSTLDRRPSDSPDETKEYKPLVHGPDDPLYLIGGESMRYWNTSNMERMANRKPRASGDTATENDALNRKQSLVSKLSSEESSSLEQSLDASVGDEERCRVCKGTEFKIAVQRVPKTAKEGELSPTKHLICSKCGASAS